MRFSVWLEEPVAMSPSPISPDTPTPKSSRFKSFLRNKQANQERQGNTELPDDFWGTYMPPKQEMKPSAVPPSSTRSKSRSAPKIPPKPPEWERWLMRNPDPDPDPEPDTEPKLDIDPSHRKNGFNDRALYYGMPDPHSGGRLMGAGGRRWVRHKYDDDEIYNYNLEHQQDVP